VNNYEKERQIVEWLEDYNAYKAGIENLNEIVDDIAEAGMGIAYDKDPSGKTNKFSSVTENAAIELSKHNIHHRLKIMNNIVSMIDKALASLTDTEREIIINRCIKRQYYYQFCYKICVGERTARRIKKEALHKMIIVIFGKE
jgi:RinA family phage transcriptional activator